MMKRCGVFAAGTVAALVLSVLPAAAQSTVPDTGMNAFGVTLGASMPYDDSLDKGIDMGVQYERYLSPRMSIRGKLSGAWFDVDGRGFDGTVHPIAFEANVVHNWERGVWHPFATAGVGFYHFDFEESDLDSGDTRFGINLGGGAEYFLSRTDTVLGEATFRIIPGDAEGLLADYDSGYWTLAVGYKKYF
jgi:hypothetical protein